MSITIDNKNLNITQLSDEIQWQGNDGSTQAIANGCYGEIKDVTVIDGNLKVQTSLGTMTISGDVDLLPPSFEAKLEDYAATSNRLPDVSQGIDLIDCLKLLHETNKQRREVSREVRHADREAAASEARAAAHEIMSGALTNMIFGIVSGAVNIGMGCLSVAGSLKAMSTMKSSCQQVSLAKSEVSVAKANVNFQQSKANLAEARVQLKGLQDGSIAPPKGMTKQEAINAQMTKIDSLKAECTQAHADLKTQQQALETKLTKAETRAKAQVESSTQKLDKLNAEAKQYTDAGKPIPDKLQAKIDTQQAKMADAKAELQTYQESLQNAKLEHAKSANFKTSDVTADKADAIKSDLAAAQKQLGVRGDNGLYPEGSANQKLSAAEKARADAMTEVQTKVNLYHSIGQVGQGVAGILTSIGGYAESLGQARAKERDAAAEIYRAGADDAKDDMQNASDILREVRETFNSIRQSNAQVWQHITSA
jgi:hypothetical protein